VLTRFAPKPPHDGCQSSLVAATVRRFGIDADRCRGRFSGVARRRAVDHPPI